MATYEVNVDGQNFRVELSRAEGRTLCKVDGREIEVDAVITDREVLSLIVNGRSYEVKRERTATDDHVVIGGGIRFATEVRDPRSLRTRKAAGGGEEGPKKLVAPMPGKVVRVLAAANTEVEAGQGVVVVEAMKMQNELKSPKKGVVKQLLASEGQAVNAGDVLAIVE